MIKALLILPAIFLTINRAGVLRDSRRANIAWNSKATVATGEEDRAWTVEIAIPLSSLEADLSKHKNWGFQLLRHRPHADEVYEWNLDLSGTKSSPEGYGQLIFP